jgi:hypothetical protein
VTITLTNDPLDQTKQCDSTDDGILALEALGRMQKQVVFCDSRGYCSKCGVILFDHADYEFAVIPMIVSGPSSHKLG